VSRINDDFEIVVQFLAHIAAKFGRDDPLRIGIEARDAKVDRVLGVNDPNFGLFRRWLPLKGLALRKVVDWNRLLPKGIVKGSV
jgi:hypothetical protein